MITRLQALPVVVAALKQACRSRVCLESALRSGAFLFVQQSLLSDLNANERSYLQVRSSALHAADWCPAMQDIGWRCTEAVVWTGILVVSCGLADS